jgi:ubiquinone/menaquinone biosynthesis C-methylase UbiE
MIVHGFGDRNKSMHNDESLSRYDSVAAWYDTFVRFDANAGNFVLPHLFELAGDVRGLEVCDLACGQGRLSRELALRGAHVLGVDISEALLTMALRAEEFSPQGITYRLDNAESLASIPDMRFDGVLCNMALMDIDDLDAVLRTVFRILRPSGWFVFNITHPCFESPGAEWLTTPDGMFSREIRHYFGEGYWRSNNPNGVRGKVGVHHRMVSTYVNALIQGGFAIEQMLEPQADGVVAERVPGYRVVPSFMLMKCIRP